MSKFYRKLYAVHKWAGLISGIFILLFSISGTLLVFGEELDEGLNEEWREIQQKGDRILSLDSMYKIALAKFPDATAISWVNPESADGHETYEFRAYTNDGNVWTYDLGVVSMNPYTGEVYRAGKLNTLEGGLMNWIYQFHFSFQLGIPGTLFTGLFGISLVISALSGLLIYRKHLLRALLLRLPLRKRNFRILNSNWHRTIGVWPSLIAIFIFFTGFWLNLFVYEKETWEKNKHAVKGHVDYSGKFNSLYKAVLKEYPGFEAMAVRMPTQKGKQVMIHGDLPEDGFFFKGENQFAFDPVTGALHHKHLLADMSAGEKLDALAFPLHTGRFGPEWIKVLYVIFGLCPGLLSITGFILWKRKYVN